jgi:hypothetical protein
VGSPLAELADRIRDLTEPGRYEAGYRILVETDGGKNYAPRIHRSTHASLLDQLRECRHDRAQTETEAANSPARTVPHIDLDAIDRLTAISDATAEWLKELHIESRAIQYEQWCSKTAARLSGLTGGLWAPTELYRAAGWLRIAAGRIGKRFDYDLPALVGAAATTDPDTAAQIGRDVARWCTWCRIFAGWETPPWRPRARCPHCDTAAGVDGDRPAGLRVRLDIRSAVCLTCSTTWCDDAGAVPIELLAEHIRQTIDQPLTPDQVDALRDPAKLRESQNRGGKA